MFRKEIARKYINVEDVHHFIWHNWSIFVKSTIKTLFFLFVLYLIYSLVWSYIEWEFLPWVFWLIGIGFFIKFIIDFLNFYLDWLILSSEGITMFMREWLTKYKTDFFEWETIQTVSHRQDTARDKILSKWDILIRLEHDIEFPFEDVTMPSKQVSRILALKDKYLATTKAKEKKSAAIDQDKLSLLTEAFSEVVKEYLDKKWNKEETEEYEY